MKEYYFEVDYDYTRKEYIVINQDGEEYGFGFRSQLQAEQYIKELKSFSD